MKLYRCMNKKEFNEAVELGLQMHCLKGGSFCFLPENIPTGNGATITPADVLPCIRDGEILVEFEAPDAMLPQPVLGSYDDPFAEEDEWGCIPGFIVPEYHLPAYNCRNFVPLRYSIWRGEWYNINTAPFTDAAEEE